MVIAHVRFTAFQMADVAVLHDLFGAILDKDFNFNSDPSAIFWRPWHDSRRWHDRHPL